MTDLEKRKITDIVVSSNDLLSFVSCSATNVGRSTFYNMKEEQRQELINQHLPILTKARGFYALMMLPEATNDVNKSMIAFHLVANTLRQEGLSDNQHDPVTLWENELITQVINNMQPNRVFDLFEMLVDKKVSNKRTCYIVHRWLKEHEHSWELWAIKYRKPFKKVLRHFHNGMRKHNADLRKIWRYLKYDETTQCGQLIMDYKSVQEGNRESLVKLPITVAEGFLKRFNIDKATFLQSYTKVDAGKLTAKETRQRDSQVRKAGAQSKLDLKKLSLWDLLVYLRGIGDYPASLTEIHRLLDNKAKKIASTLSFNFKDAGVIIDSSISMAGSKEEPFHPMLRAIAMGFIFKHATSGSYKVYWTSSDSTVGGLFPKLKNQSNYADAVMQALKDGCKQIIIIGDGYENAPFEGALHQLLFTFKQKVDVTDEVTIMHFNPVFSAESGDVRVLSDLAGHIGIRDINSLDESTFLALARANPVQAIVGYIKKLLSLQNARAKELLPDTVKENLTALDRKLLT
jgi:hypothetical protein